MSQSLAVKYRPNTFEDVCGQSVTVKILEKVVANKALKHAYLFAGDSGCGKTTLARIFANKINNGEGSPIELDAASQRDIDTIRAIRDSANTRAIDSEYKIYIIDECQSYTIVQWQAFLKAIEETPEYTIFMFCTTEPNKLPQAILNRLQRYNITKIDAETIKNRLIYICQQEGFTNYVEGCDLISKFSNGCMRDAIMKLEQCSDYSTEISKANVSQVLAGVSYEKLFGLTWALQAKDDAKVLEAIESLYNSGEDLKSFIESYIEFNLDLTKYILFNNIQLTSIPGSLATAENPVVQSTVEAKDIEWFKSLIDLLLEIKLNIKYDSAYRSTIEAYLLRFCR